MAKFEDILKHASPEDVDNQRSKRLRDEWVERREAVVALHEERGSGRKVLQRLTALTDQLLVALYKDALRRTSAGGNGVGIALVAVGGYGRGELNPHSDVDLLFLYDTNQTDAAKEVSNAVLYPLWDMRLTVGHSVRTVSDCVEVGLADLSAHTCMMESRLLCGDADLYGRFVKGFAAKVVKKDVFSFLYRKAEEQRSRHKRFGATVFLQQPNVKESPGGLRDIHYLIWVGIARYGTGNLKELADQGVLDPQDYTALIKAQGFLWRVRNDIHFAYDKAVDVLTFEEQLRVSQHFGFVDTKAARDVERFMRRYYLHAARVLDICSRFVERANTRSLTTTLSTMIFSRRVAPYFVLTSREISVESRKMEAFFKDGAGVINLFHLAQAYGLRVHPDTIEALSHGNISRRIMRTHEASRVFMEILGWNSGVAETLKRMHRLGILGRILPEFARIDRLVTFSQYHQYTVDAHTLYALEIAEGLMQQDDIYGKAYREIRRKDLLYLAILLHDAGKGQHRDHCEVGAELCLKVAARLGLSQDDTDLLCFLVREHLAMTHIGFRRDLSDPVVLSQFARRMETSERLKMLCVLTHVDIRAVGPGTWNAWKDGLLSELYMRSIQILAGRRLVMDMPKAVAAVRDKVSAAMEDEDPAWLDEVLDKAPGRYLVGHPVDDIVRHLKMIRALQDNPALVELTPMENGVIDITVCAHDRLVPALFSNIAGVLTAKDLKVLDARIATFKDDVVLDEFRVQDPNAGDYVDPGRLKRIRSALVDTLLGRIEVADLFKGGHGQVSHEDIDFSDTEPMVKLDNETSDSFSVLDVFAADRQGLLYMITRAIAELDLHIFFSRIATKADRVVDVFYVKEGKGGNKITDPERIAEIREYLLTVVTEHHGVEG